MKDLLQITQSGIRRLIVERLENPSEYTGRPVVIWRSAYNDGIQAFLVYNTCREYNVGRTEDEWKWYKHLKVDVGKAPAVSNANPHQKVCMVEVAIPTTPKQFPDILNDDWLKEIEQHTGMPIIVFMCCNEQADAFTIAEQYLFTPSLHEWLEYWKCSQNSILHLVVDFLNTVKNSEATDYYWYWHFKRSGKEDHRGCDFPEVWFVAVENLRCILKLKRAENISDLSPEDFRSAFGKGISHDIVERFHNFVSN